MSRVLTIPFPLTDKMILWLVLVQNQKEKKHFNKYEHGYMQMIPSGHETRIRITFIAFICVHTQGI